MASNETTVSGDVLYQSGDDLSEANLTRSAARSNATDYVERGLAVIVDAAAGTIDIDSGHCIVQDGVHAYDVFPNQITDISLPAPNGVNHVYLVIDETVDDDIAYHVDDDDTPPANPSLKIATADGDAGTSTPLNPRPDVQLGDTDIQRLVAALDANGQDITGVGAFDSDSVSTKQIASNRYNAGAFAGSDPDARLDNALSAIGSNSRLYLESATYTKDRSIGSTSKLIGPTYGGASVIDANWTLNGFGTFLSHFRVSGTGQITLAENISSVSHSNSGGGSIEAQASGNQIRFCDNVSVTLTSNTSGCIVDGLTRSSVTDNGTNNIVGDVS
ncbi:hypothetical protein [Haloarcula sp. CGMCC 1.6347]|uniref:hypothetical protein n=1 Tax=Haloarcula sp. CGMCC 1.6347 TaxID=3111455 RepID=UPI00300F7A9C